MRLRTRLVLWFVAAIVVTVLMSFTLGSQVWRLFYRDYDAGQDAHAAVLSWQKGGRDGLREWLHERRREDGLFGLLLDENGASLGGRGHDGPPPPRLREAIAAAEAGNHLVMLPGGSRLRTTVVVSNDGKRLRWVAVLPPPRGPDVRRIDTLLLLAIGVIVVSFAAWLIARRITQPIAALQAASRAVAEGHLDARVPAETSARGDEIGALARDFNDMAARLQRLLDSQQQLLRDISHELRSPLARLRIATELARDTRAESQFDRIELEADKLEDMIAQLLLIARLEHREAPMATELFAVDEVLEAVCDDAGFEAQTRGITVQTELAPELKVRGQPALLHSAIENVVRNALRYAATDSTVTVRLTQTGSRCTIDVEDRGPGIPDDRIDAMFQPFVRISEARDRASGGYGLGLAIAKRVVDASGGTIRAHNREGGGLRVSIDLPLTDA